MVNKGYISSKVGKKALTEDQARRLLEYCTDLMEKTLLELALNTGIRRRDIINIKRSNIDFVNKKLTFYEHKKDRFFTIPLNQKLLNSLEIWIKVAPKSKWLFPSKRGGHISSKTAYNILQRNLKRAGLPQRPFHALRATCIKLCQKRGWTPEQVSELTGDLISTIQQHYLTPSEEEMKKIVEEKPLL